jgi:hypothetical protein
MSTIDRLGDHIQSKIVSIRMLNDYLRNPKLHELYELLTYCHTHKIENILSILVI